MFEAMGQLRPALPPCDSMQIVEQLGHAPELDFEDARHLPIAYGTRPTLRPTRHALEHLEGLRIAGQHVYIQQAGHDFVDRVPGRPNRKALTQAIKKTRRKRAEVAAAERFLAAAHLS